MTVIVLSQCIIMHGFYPIKFSNEGSSAPDSAADDAL